MGLTQQLCKLKRNSKSAAIQLQYDFIWIYDLQNQRNGPWYCVKSPMLQENVIE